MHRNLISMVIAVFTVSLTMSAHNTLAGPVILLVGDSTVAVRSASGKGNGRGWGEIIPEFFRNDVVIKNAAASGRSSKSFIEEGRWDKAIALKPNYVFILWGTNDSQPDEVRHTDPSGSFRDYLRKYIDDSVAAGAVPVLITPSAIRLFNLDKTIKNTLDPYVAAMKEVAAEKKVCLIDLNGASISFYNQLGPEESQKLAQAPSDRIHYNEDGARAMSKLIAQAIPSSVPSLAPSLVTK